MLISSGSCTARAAFWTCARLFPLLNKLTRASLENVLGRYWVPNPAYKKPEVKHRQAAASAHAEGDVEAPSARAAPATTDGVDLDEAGVAVAQEQLAAQLRLELLKVRV